MLFTPSNTSVQPVRRKSSDDHHIQSGDDDDEIGPRSTEEMHDVIQHTKRNQVVPVLEVAPVSRNSFVLPGSPSHYGSLASKSNSHHEHGSPKVIDTTSGVRNVSASTLSIPSLPQLPDRNSTRSVESTTRRNFGERIVRADSSKAAILPGIRGAATNGTNDPGSPKSNGTFSSPSNAVESLATIPQLPDRHSTRSVDSTLRRGIDGRVSRGGSTGRLGSNGRDSGRSGSALRMIPPRESVAVAENSRDPRYLFFIKWGQFRHHKFRMLTRLFPIIDPRSSAKLAWDILIMIIALYSAVMVPLEVGYPAFVVPIGWRVCNMMSDSLFALDVFFNFFVGFYEGDVMITDRTYIARRYLTTWFTLDVFAIFPFEYILNGLNARNTDSSIKSLKLTRMIRLARVTKLARLIKLRQFAIKVENILGINAVVARMTQLFCQVALVTHVCSCFWHLVGTSDDVNDLTWITDAELQNASMPVTYLYSTYWVVTTLAGVGYGDIHAVNTDERLYSMGVAVIGAAGFGILIGNMTKILENWNRNTTTRARKMSFVQEFLKKRAIPKKLKADILRYFRHYIAKTSAFDERELLSEFSLSLRSDILSETYQNSFFQIPAFQRLSPQFVMDMAMYIKPLIAVKGDVLAREHAVGTEMFILNHGIVEVQRKANGGEWMIVLEVLTAHGIFGESSVVNYTLHKNTYIARADCDLYTLPKEDFDRLLEEFPEVEQTLLTYHKERMVLYDRVYEQTLARYHVFTNTKNNDPVSELTGIENIYPTLTVLLDGVLVSYRNISLEILQNMTLEISMGISVFNSAVEKNKMIQLLSQKDDVYIHWRYRMRKKLRTLIPSDHPWKSRWDLMIGLLLIYCAISIPYEIAFGTSNETNVYQDGSISNIIEYLIEGLFAIDILLSFRTTTVDQSGRVITSDREIAHRYLTSWFWIDTISTLPIATIVSASIQHLQVAGSRNFYFFWFRIFRLLKLARLLKLLRTVMQVESITLVSHSSSRVLRLIFIVILIGHLLSCGFYYVSVTCADEYGKASVLSLFPDDASNYDKYVFSLYWAIATMTTVGYGDTPPGNPPEVAYVTFGLLVGALTFTYVIGTLSSIIDDMNATEDSNRARMDRLKAYLKERGLSHTLSTRLRRYYEYYLSQRDDEGEDTILSSLSDNLRSQTILHLNRHVVSKIGFFASQDDRCVSYLMEILDPEFCTPGEYVFKEGQVGRHMYFLVKGSAEVLFQADTPKEVVVATLLEGSYFGEIAMLTKAKRAASIRAKTHISLFVLSRSGLDRISQHYPDMANNIIQEFKKKITHIKQTPNIGPWEMRATKPYTLNTPELNKTLGDLEVVIETIVSIYGGGDRGKRKALSCVMNHLRKFEFSLDDFVDAVEEFNDRNIGSGSLAKLTYTSTIMTKLQHKLRRKGSFNSFKDAAY